MTADMVATAIASYLAGEPVAETAGRLGVSRPTVYLWLRKAGYRRGQPVCGTEAGYQRHLRLGNRTCEACRAAHASTQREWRSRPVEVPDDDLVAAARAGWLDRQHRVAAVVCAHARDSAEARELLEMLGLLPTVPAARSTRSALAS